MSSGWSALVLCLILGKRSGFGKRVFAPHSLVLTMIGTGMLWVGWYGFNAGSAVAADGIAANAFTATTLAAAIAAAVWPLLEWVTRGKPTVLGFCSGAVAGLVVITPAAGFVSPASAVAIGVLAGVVPYLACMKLKHVFRYDDALDTFGVHGVGGTLGALVTGFFASAESNPNLATNLGGLVGKSLWLEQLKAMGLTVSLSVGATVVIGFGLKAALGLRPALDAEEEGLDLTDHGEAGYHPDEGGAHGTPDLDETLGVLPPAAAAGFQRSERA
jgi:Amt family ammonium transporter